MNNLHEKNGIALGFGIGDDCGNGISDSDDGGDGVSDSDDDINLNHSEYHDAFMQCGRQLGRWTGFCISTSTSNTNTYNMIIYGMICAI